MLWLLPFGSALARRFGAIRFFIFMAVTAAAGALAHLVTHEHAVAPMIGASASVSGTMAAAMRFAFVKGSFLSFSRGDADLAAKVPALSLSRALRNGRVLAFLAIWFAVNLIFGVGSIAIGTDGASGRIYLPQEDLKRFHVSEQDILDRVYNARFRELMAFECQRAREYYARAENALTSAERPMLLPAEIMRAIYHLILEQIEASHYQVFGSRISLPPWRRLATAMKVWFALRTKRK